LFFFSLAPEEEGMFSRTIVVGHLGRDPELRYTPEGTPVASFSIATSRRWTNRNGEQQEKTTWFRVSVFGKQAETVHQYLTKGRLVLVEGEVDASAWIGQDGTPRATLELRATNVRFLGARGEEPAFPEAAGEARPGARPAAARTPAPAVEEDFALFDQPESEDDLPF
jgi:single-strand DNA-binding protein